MLVVAALLILGCAQSEPVSGIPTREDTTVNPTINRTTASSVSPVGEVWQPTLHTSWQWQLTDPPIDHSIEAEMYDIDLFETSAETVAALHAEGRKVICYVNAGGWENWRPDAALFPDGVIGVDLDDWEGEKWLDIRRIDLLGPIMEARMDLCKLNGFDGIEPDNVDGFLNNTGFPLNYGDQLSYNIWLAEAAHERGLSIGLKNDMDQIADLLPYFDWALNEECFEYEECETLLPFIEVGKAVFNVEYSLDTKLFCDKATALGFSSIRKNLDLDAWREPCD
ncbi:MAG: endo alpha-1,4 polygalactosaminidase [Chloroflexi bacterium]|nr:endo alpha-1,4 polygalactosaminidase [Chloroflexota bacterium]